MIVLLGVSLPRSDKALGRCNSTTSQRLAPSCLHLVTSKINNKLPNVTFHAVHCRWDGLSNFLTSLYIRLVPNESDLHMFGHETGLLFVIVKCRDVTLSLQMGPGD